MYVSDPWYTSIQEVGKITNLFVNDERKIMPDDVTSASFVPTKALVVGRGNRVFLENKDPVNKKISFDLKLTKQPKGDKWYNILHMTIDGDRCYKGCRKPAIFLHDGKIWFNTYMNYVNNDLKFVKSFHGYGKEKLILNKKYTITLVWDDMDIFEIKINGKSQARKENLEEWFHAKWDVNKIQLYLSDPWYPSIAEVGTITNLYFNGMKAYRMY